jgi:hypothetical protein
VGRAMALVRSIERYGASHGFRGTPEVLRRDSVP